MSLLSCQSKLDIPKPKDLLSEHQMGQVLADILLLQNYSDNTVSSDSTLSIQDFQNAITDVINQKYQLKDSQAFYSYRYYVKNPDIFLRVIKISQDTLQGLFNSKDSVSAVKSVE
ncbi:MAG: DUF4296 domain-containing protein [Chitinophagales bacterium]|nr:DUF4296 domain-containing protein [Chitinophagales bacterium]